jgi:hypothetical protein
VIFWILLVIAALIPIAVAIFAFHDDGPLSAIGSFFLTGFFSLIGLVLASILISGIAAVTGETRELSDTEDLRALGSNSSIEGRSYFLGGGYIEGKRVLNYIVRRDGYSTLEQVDADQSRIFEDVSDSPYLETFYFITSNPWVVPWDVWTRYRYDFHIPADSILEGYTIDNAAG